MTYPLHHFLLLWNWSPDGKTRRIVLYVCESKNKVFLENDDWPHTALLTCTIFGQLDIKVLAYSLQPSALISTEYHLCQARARKIFWTGQQLGIFLGFLLIRKKVSYNRIFMTFGTISSGICSRRWCISYVI